MRLPHMSFLEVAFRVSPLGNAGRIEVADNAVLRARPRSRESMVGMSKREAAFLLIGLGVGLILAVVAVVELVLAFHHTFIMGISWRPGTILLGLPFALIIAGAVMLPRASIQP